MPPKTPRHGKVIMQALPKDAIC